MMGLEAGVFEKRQVIGKGLFGHPGSVNAPYICIHIYIYMRYICQTPHIEKKRKKKKETKQEKIRKQ